MNTEAVNQEYQTVTLSQLTESLTWIMREELEREPDLCYNVVTNQQHSSRKEAPACVILHPQSVCCLAILPSVP